MTPDKVEAALGVLSAIVDKTNWQPDLDAGTEAISVLTEALAGRDWQPIESAPKSFQEICEMYPDDFGSTVLIARCDEKIPGERGVISGCVAEATLLEDGRWASPTAPGLPSMGDGWTEIVNPTHWKPMPRKPAMKETP